MAQQITWKNISIPSAGRSDRYSSLSNVAGPSPLNPGLDALSQIFEDQQKMADKNRDVTIENNDMELARQVGQIKDLGAFNQMREEGQLDPNALQSQVGRWATPAAFETALNKRQETLRGQAVNEATPFALDAAKQNLDATEGGTEIYNRLIGKGMTHEQAAIHANNFNEQHAYLDPAFQKTREANSRSIYDQLPKPVNESDIPGIMQQAEQISKEQGLPFNRDSVQEKLVGSLQAVRSDEKYQWLKDNQSYTVSERKRLTAEREEEKRNEERVGTLVNEAVLKGNLAGIYNSNLPAHLIQGAVTQAEQGITQSSKLFGKNKDLADGTLVQLTTQAENNYAQMENGIAAANRDWETSSGVSDGLLINVKDASDSLEGFEKSVSSHYTNPEKVARELTHAVNLIMSKDGIENKTVAKAIALSALQGTYGFNTLLGFDNFDEGAYRKAVKAGISQYKTNLPKRDKIRKLQSDYEEYKRNVAAETSKKMAAVRRSLAQSQISGKEPDLSKDVATFTEDINKIVEMFPELAELAQSVPVSPPPKDPPPEDETENINDVGITGKDLDSILTSKVLGVEQERGNSPLSLVQEGLAKLPVYQGQKDKYPLPGESQIEFAVRRMDSGLNLQDRKRIATALRKKYPDATDEQIAEAVLRDAADTQNK